MIWFTARMKKGGVAAKAAPIDSGDANAEAALRREFSGARILVAEDEPINQMVAEQMLAEVGLMVELAGNGREAVTRAGKGGIALVLMDMQMPEMDGLEATRAIRTFADGQSLPILAMTANVFAEDRERCLAAGMNDFVNKPVDPPMLFATLLHWLRRTATPPQEPSP